MTDIGPGTCLICIKGTAEPERLTKGALYVCEYIEGNEIGNWEWEWDGCNCTSCIAVIGKEMEYCLCHFKPLNDGETSLVENEIDSPIHADLTVLA